MTRSQDIVRLIDGRISNSQDILNTAVVVSVNEVFAMVRFSGTSRIKKAAYDSSRKPFSGEECVVQRSAGRSESYVILSSYKRERTGVTSDRRPEESREMSPPTGFSQSSTIAGAIFFLWNTPPQQLVLFEIEVSIDSIVAGEIYQTRGGNLILESATDMYARARCVSAPPLLERSSWSDWVLGVVGETVVSGSASPLTTKGDLYTYGTAESRLPVGTNGQFPTADSSQALGIRWANLPTAISKTRTTQTLLYDETLSATGAFDVENADLVAGSGNIADYEELVIVIEARSTDPATGSNVVMYYNNDTVNGNYRYARNISGSGHYIGAGSLPQIGLVPGAGIPSEYVTPMRIHVYNPSSDKHKVSETQSVLYDTNFYTISYSHWWVATAAINRIMLRLDTHSTYQFSTGSRLRIYGIRNEEIAGGSENVRQAIYFFGNALVVGQHPQRIVNHYGSARVLSKVVLYAGTAPTGSSIIVDVLVNNVTIFTNPANRPVIAASANNGLSTVINVPSWAAGAYMEVVLAQVGSTLAGSNLTVTLVFGELL